MITILYSGGLDSLIMHHYAELEYSKNVDIRCLWFDIGQPYVEKERAALPSFVEQRKVDWLNVPGSATVKGKENESGQIYIPGRNAALITLAACMTNPDEIWLGALLGETHDKATDKNLIFKNKIEDMLNYALSPFRKGGLAVRYPLAEAGFNKLTSVKWALDSGLLPSDLRKTSSCLSGEKGNCGRCVVCLRRWGIFTQCGFSEQYNVDPLSVDENKRIIWEMLKPNSYYDSHRKSEIIPALSSDYIFKLQDEHYLYSSYKQKEYAWASNLASL